MYKRNITRHLLILILLLLVLFPSGCASTDDGYKDDWVQKAQEGTLVMAPGYDANWDSPPLRPLAHK